MAAVRFPDRLRAMPLSRQTSADLGLMASALSKQSMAVAYRPTFTSFSPLSCHDRVVSCGAGVVRRASERVEPLDTDWSPARSNAPARSDDDLSCSTATILPARQRVTIRSKQLAQVATNAEIGRAHV